MSQGALEIRLNRASGETDSGSSPVHHIVPDKTALSGWWSYLPSWNPAPGITRPKKPSDSNASQQYQNLAGFRNPWPSWHKPTRQETWESLRWGEDNDPCIELAASHLSSEPPAKPEADKLPNFSYIDDWPHSTAAQAAQLLQMQKPDFTFNSRRLRVTWLGHASALIQLAPTAEGSRPIRCLFDPMFSMRCSPSQSTGPIRTYRPPCEIKDLPPIDLVFISHNHYDHLDYDSIMSLWNINKAQIRFVVPLANLQWFVDSGIPADTVTELDWWDSVSVMYPGSKSSALNITCTPAQHSSGRTVIDTDSTLWCSWFLEHTQPKPFRIFFAGDTGYQFHPSPNWPPSPPSTRTADNAAKSSGSRSSSTDNDDNGNGEEDVQFPVCPAFREIRSRLGRPHLLLLPIWVGATFQYFRSFVWVPDYISPFPRHSEGLTGATHIPPWDALRVFRVLTAPSEDDSVKRDDGEPSVAVAMHWGTFVSDPLDVLKTLGQLEWACMKHDVRFARDLPGENQEEPCFLALNHGQSVSL